MPYTHLSADQRVELGALLQAGTSYSAIAKQLGKHRTTIWREIKRNGTNTSTGYHAGVAKRRTRQRRVVANQRFRRLTHEPELRRIIVRDLKKYWSPEQIAGRLKREQGIIICHQTIYRYIYQERPELKIYLRSRKGKYRRRSGTRKRTILRNMAKKPWIEQRPSIVEERTRIGDWEGDTIVGTDKTSRLLTHVERKSGYLLADKLEGATMKDVNTATINRFRYLPRTKRHTITYDNGVEFAGYEWIERGTKTDVYFAHPYSSWERGTNENTNGLLRQYFPKKTSLQGITQEMVDKAAKLINNRPRKRLNYLTPAEVFHGRVAL